MSQYFLPSASRWLTFLLSHPTIKKFPTALNMTHVFGSTKLQYVSVLWMKISFIIVWHFIFDLISLTWWTSVAKICVILWYIEIEKSLSSRFVWVYRSSRSDVFCLKGVLRKSVKFTGKYLCQSLSFDKVVLVLYK